MSGTLHALAYLAAFVGLCVSCYTWIVTEKPEERLDAKVTTIVCLLIMHDQKSVVCRNKGA
jgi:hypothetical protein